MSLSQFASGNPILATSYSNLRDYIFSVNTNGNVDFNGDEMEIYTNSVICSSLSWPDPIPYISIISWQKYVLEKHKTYCLQFKRKLMAWLWRARERIAMRYGHPDRMRERIEAAGGDLDVVFGY